MVLHFLHLGFTKKKTFCLDQIFFEGVKKKICHHGCKKKVGQRKNFFSFTKNTLIIAAIARHSINA